MPTFTKLKSEAGAFKSEGNASTSRTPSSGAVRHYACRSRI